MAEKPDKLRSRRKLALCLLLSFLPLAGSLQAQQDLTLLDFGHLASEALLAAPGIGAKVEETAEGTVLRVELTSADPYAGLTLNSPPEGWDLSPFLYVSMDVYNSGPGDALVSCRVNGSKWVDGAIVVPSRQKRSLLTLLKRAAVPSFLEKKLFGMNGLPGGLVWLWDDVKLSHVSKLVILVPEPLGVRNIVISNVRATGRMALPSEQSLASTVFPLIDRFGQFRHADWPGKTHSDQELKTQREAEERDLAANPPPSDWDRYGGWKTGPQLEATGYFRVAKHEGRWWLVDPEGRLFWSHGIDCVRMRNSTPVTDRQQYFEELPAKDSPLGAFYGSESGAARGYYREHSPYETYDFYGANLLRKYGGAWQDISSALIHRRLPSWGLNTIANWSDPGVYLQKKTPYVATIHSGGRRIEGSEGYWGKFPDPFDPGFRQSLADQMTAEKGKSAEDPWCIGYFVDNELSWGDDTNLATAALLSPPDQPAKKAFADWLKQRYPDVRRLNAAWGTTYDSWDSLLQTRKAPDGPKARKDVVGFNREIADQYFRVCNEEVKRAAPKNLYLGCRFDFHFYPGEDREQDWLVTVAARFCDVVSFNRYRFSARELQPPKGVDKPIIIGEFHFGALDRGMFHTGLRSVANQEERAEMYARFVRSALENPFIVGTHWFQYADQPTTGRGDGENYQVGFVDVCDLPYRETIQASRRVGNEIYQIRR